MSRKANRKSQKFFLFVKMIENHEGMAIHFKVYDNNFLIFSHFFEWKQHFEFTENN